MSASTPVEWTRAVTRVVADRAERSPFIDVTSGRRIRVTLKSKLAYEIDGFKEGNYIMMHFESGPTVPHELNRLMGIHDDVIRHRIFKFES